MVSAGAVNIRTVRPSMPWKLDYYLREGDSMGTTAQTQSGQAAGCGCLGLMGLLILGFCIGGAGGPDSSRYTPPSYPPSYTPPAAERTTYEPRDWLYIHGNLNVRDAPNRDAAILRTLHRGDYVQLGPRDANGWAPVYRGGSAEGYVYRASDLVQLSAPSGQGGYSTPSRHYIRGSRGGCYYINSNGNRTYVDRDLCDGAQGSPQLSAPSGSGPSAGGSRRSSGGRVLHRGPRGGCYYINSNGNKTYVDRSECN